jgi:hypothetical protein
LRSATVAESVNWLFKTKLHRNPAALARNECPWGEGNSTTACRSKLKPATVVGLSQRGMRNHSLIAFGKPRSFQSATIRRTDSSARLKLFTTNLSPLTAGS